MVIIAVFLYIFFVLSSVLLIFLVLIQDEQGEGLGGIFGGGSSTPFGSRSGNILTRATSIVGAVFLISSLGLAWVNRTPDSDQVIQAARKSAGTDQQTLQWWNETPDLNASENAAPDAAPSPEPAAAETNAPPAETQPPEPVNNQ